MVGVEEFVAVTIGDVEWVVAEEDKCLCRGGEVRCFKSEGRLRNDR
jgi:hypothetical protein